MRQDTTPVRVFGYGRASTDKQTLTMASQKAIVEASFSSRTWPAGSSFSWHGDADVSSKLSFLQRPGGLAISSQAKAGDVLMTSAYDRLWRGLTDFLETLDWLKTTGVELVILDMGGIPVDTTTPYGRFMLQIMAVVKQLERDEIGRRTAEVLRDLRNRQEVGRRKVYGYFSALVRNLAAPDEKPRWILLPHAAERVFAYVMVEKKLKGSAWEKTPYPIGTMWNFWAERQKFEYLHTADARLLNRHGFLAMCEGHVRGWPVCDRPYEFPDYPYEVLERIHLGRNLDDRGCLLPVPVTHGMPNWTSEPALVSLVRDAEDAVLQRGRYLPQVA